MGRPRLDLKGKKFNKLIVLEFSHYKNRSAYWDCLCDCGNKKKLRGDRVKKGEVKSCGCLPYESFKHGHAKRSLKNKSSRTYLSWLHMRRRCLSKNNPAFGQYGGRGIKICDRWNSFENFVEDMGECPPGKTLDRIDTNSDYKPLNCRWATSNQQARNRRGKIKSTSRFKGVVRCNDKWRSRIRVNNKEIHLGVYSDEVQAARVYNEKAFEVWGEDAYQNPV